MDAVDIRMWRVKISKSELRLVFDDYPVMVSMESSDDAGDETLKILLGVLSPSVELLEQAMSTNNPNNDLLPCPCCGSCVFTAPCAYEICDACGWEDDPVQSSDPEYAGGANKLSLTESRKRWLARNGKKT